MGDSPMNERMQMNQRMTSALRAAAAACCVALGAPALAEGDNGALTAESPDGACKVTFSIDGKGRPSYALEYKGKIVIEKSQMGFDLRGGTPLREGFAVVGTETSEFHEKWKPVWGEESEISDDHNELLVRLEQKGSKRKMNIRFRAFDDGLGFRYEFPVQREMGHFVIGEERTGFRLPCDATAWWIPEDYYTQEYNYIKSRVSEIPELFKKHGAMNYRGVSDKRNFPKEPGVQTALMLKYDNGLYVNIHEAACIDYATMHLRYAGNGGRETGKGDFAFESRLTPDAIGDKGRLYTPCNSPWRTVIVGEKGADILASRITLNLNEPCKIKDTSWIRPMKYVGVWWEMITGRSAWSYTGDFSAVRLGVTDYSKAKPHGRHGATTEHVMKYIDFAAAHGMGGVLVEGWNVGWEDWSGKKKFYVFDFVTPYPDFDLPKLRDYAKSKGVELVMHHETSSSTLNYERHLDKAYRFMVANNYHRVKSGYVGEILPAGDLHYSQSMNNHYLYCIKKAAEYKIMVNAHEATRPTGICRTWPNWIGNESARGTEYEAFHHNEPGHTTILPFTRLVGGPMDYTPGIFETQIKRGSSRHKGKGEKWLSSTIAGQLALYVTMYSPMPMAADLVENYETRLDAFKFIEDVACDWDRSIYIEAEPGEVVTVVRKAKGSDDWFAGSKTNEKARDTKLVCDFLDAGRTYEATIYADAPDAVLRTPTSKHYVITKRDVAKGDVLDMRSAPGGGWAISFKAK